MLYLVHKDVLVLDLHYSEYFCVFVTVRMTKFVWNIFSHLLLDNLLIIVPKYCPAGQNCFVLHNLSDTRAWSNNYTRRIVWDVIGHTCPKINDCFCFTACWSYDIDEWLHYIVFHVMQLFVNIITSIVVLLLGSSCGILYHGWNYDMDGQLHPIISMWCDYSSRKCDAMKVIHPIFTGCLIAWVQMPSNPCWSRKSIT